LDFDGAEKCFLGTQGSPAKHAAENLFPFSNSRQSRLKRRKNRFCRFFCTKFRANREMGKDFPPHVSQGTQFGSKKIRNHKNVKSNIKEVLVGRVKNIFFRFSANQVSDRLQETL